MRWREIWIRKDTIPTQYPRSAVSTSIPSANLAMGLLHRRVSDQGKIFCTIGNKDQRTNFEICWTTKDGLVERGFSWAGSGDIISSCQNLRRRHRCFSLLRAPMILGNLTPWPVSKNNVIVLEERRFTSETNHRASSVRWHHWQIQQRRCSSS